MFVMPGPPWRRKTRARAGCFERARMRVTGRPISRDCASARFSGHDERAAVGGVPLPFSVAYVRSPLEDEVAGLGARGVRQPGRRGENRR